MTFKWFCGHTLLIKVAISWGSCTCTPWSNKEFGKNLCLWAQNWPLWLLSKDSCCNLWQCFWASSFCRKVDWSACKQSEMSFHHIHREHALLLFWAVEKTEAMGMSTAVKENQITQHFGSWLFNSCDFSPPWMSLRRCRDVYEILGPHPFPAEEPQAWLPAAMGRRKGLWSEPLQEAGCGWHGWEVCELWDKKTCDTRTVLLHSQRRNFHFPSFLIPCSSHSLILDLFPLSSHWAPGGTWSWGGFWTGNVSSQALLHGHTNWPCAPWGHGRASSTVPLPILVIMHVSQISPDALASAIWPAWYF